MEDEKVATNGHGPAVDKSSPDYLKFYEDRLVRRYAERQADADFEEDTSDDGVAQAVAARVRQLTITTEAKRQHEEIVLAAAVTDNTSWQAQDAGPFLRGEVEVVLPVVGAQRDDEAVSLCYPGLEHAAVGNIESGKTWLMLLSAVGEIRKGNHVVYIHFEESDSIGTFERLQAMGLTGEQIDTQFTFVGPVAMPLPGQVEALIRENTTLAILDGVNEAISLLGGEHYEVASTSGFRQKIVDPFLERGIATFSCDHFPINSDARRTAAFGSVHKGAVINGARYSVENIVPFGRNMDGRSNIYVTKDRPGRMRQHGHFTNVPGKTLIGVLDIRSAGRIDGSVEVVLRAPSEEEQASAASSGNSATHAAAEEREQLQNIIYQTVRDLPEHRVESRRALFGIMRDAGRTFSDSRAVEAIDVLLARTEGSRLQVFRGNRGAIGYEAPPILTVVDGTPEGPSSEPEGPSSDTDN